MTVVKGSKITKKAAPYYLELSNSYATLGKFSVNPGPININIKQCAGNSTSLPKSNNIEFKAKAAAKHESKTAAYIAAMNDDGSIDRYINLAKTRGQPLQRTRAGTPTTQTRRHQDLPLGRRGWALVARWPQQSAASSNRSSNKVNNE